MTSSHLIADLHLTLFSDVNLNTLDDTLIRIFTGLNTLDFALTLVVDFVKLTLVIIDDLHDLDLYWRGIDLDIFGDGCETTK